MTLHATLQQTSTDAALFALLTITSADGSSILRVVNNTEPVVSRGSKFEAYPFEIILPGAEETTTPSATLTIDNVDLRITAFIRELLEPPTFKVELILSTDPDTVERGIDFLTLSNVTYNAASIQGTLAPMDPLSLPAIDSVYTGVEFPDLFY